MYKINVYSQTEHTEVITLKHGKMKKNRLISFFNLANNNYLNELTKGK